MSSAAAGLGEQRRVVKPEVSFSWPLFTVEPGAPFSLVTFFLGEQKKVTGPREGTVYERQKKDFLDHPGGRARATPPS